MERVRRFEFVAGASAKFWEIAHAGAEVTVSFGRLGTNGQTQTKDLGSEAAAALQIDKLIKEKLAKGYVEVTGTEAAGPRIDFSKGITRPPAPAPYEAPQIPANGPADIGGVPLPAGRRLAGDARFAPPGEVMIPAPVLWLTDAPVADAGAQLERLRAPAAQMGLVPMLLTGLESDSRRPWDKGEFSPTDPHRIDHVDAARELADAWRTSLGEEGEGSLDPVQPFGRDFPGLAVPPTINAPAEDRHALAALTSRRIGLVAANRPADTITALGWIGAVNVHRDPVIVSAALRSWEDRWAARVVEIGFDTLTLTVGNPPHDRQTALALAAEHFALCPDNIYQGSETLEAYAKGLIDSRTWTFWWD